MFQITEDKVVRNEYSTIPYTWIQWEKPKKSFCIMLPGLGYSTQMPLFYYATNMCLAHNIDVLHVNYQFFKNEQFEKLPDGKVPSLYTTEQTALKLPRLYIRK